MTRHVLISCLHLQRQIDRYLPVFRKNNISIETPPIDQQMRENDLLHIIDRFDGVIAGDDEFTGTVLKQAKKLKVISKWGVGIDGIDLEEAARWGICVKNTPGVFSDEVADVVTGYIILLSRRLHEIDRRVRSGEWNATQMPGISLSGKTLGVIGVGNIGREVCRRAAALRMNILGHDFYSPPQPFMQETKTHMVSLDELISSSDFISLNCNLTKENLHLLNNEMFLKMKRGVFIINTSRGGLIDEAALADALQKGIVAGAALDVFEKEPLPDNSPLRTFDSCIFGCHNSSNTKEAVERVNELAINNLIEGLTNGKRS
jgi:D-3-phosphoglycerate dehydrogenase / 2-oxoglutarate reductase